MVIKVEQIYCSNSWNKCYSKSIMPMLSETSKHNDGELLSAPILTNKTKYKFNYFDCPDLNMQTHHTKHNS